MDYKRDETSEQVYTKLGTAGVGRRKSETEYITQSRMTKGSNLEISHGIKNDKERSYADAVRNNNDKKKNILIERKNELV
jgi:hypothetical protein